MKYFRTALSILLLITAAIVPPIGIAADVTTGKIRHNGVDADGSLQTIHQDVIGGVASVTNYYFEVCEGNVPDRSCEQKFGLNPDIDNAATYETIWGNGGAYTGFDATGAETIEVSAGGAADAGTLVSSGTATDGSVTTIVDDSATFVSDGVAVADAILNDTELSHGIITEVTSETTLTVFRWDVGSTFTGTAESGDSYRIVTPASTGAAVIELDLLLDANLANETREFIILNGTTGVDTVGTYRRNSRGRIILAGIGGENATAITSRQKTTTANVFMVMPAGFNNTMIVAYTLPSDVEGHLFSWFAGLAGKTNADCTARIRVRHYGEVFAVQELIALQGTGSSFVPRHYSLPKNAMPPGSDIEVQASCDQNDTGVAAGFNLIKSTD